ncbi:MAG: hypothetical protein N2036_10465, partial [Bryobacteraceae bacterium]|nr:hypothetical protein [Bryobacteraceae bacterium]
MRFACTLALALLGVASLPLAAQTAKKYTGPRPEKADVPYLLHATRLIELEQKVASEAKTKEGTVYTVAGAESPVKTPVPEPIFLFRADKINPDRLTLFRMTVRGGSRTLTFPEGGRRRKDGPKPVFLLVTMLEPGLYRVEVNEPLEDGE